ncbi:hypothetical protein Bca52824_096954 [Brassica carinata]|uniref:Uncharacterized protein n=1 Tax=Brassica carinata TaxID=52824 RepID=A0A8X7TGM7_BRACI|nr:hypothetical protein Bca52824_096954 [Brassica carinata]
MGSPSIENQERKLRSHRWKTTSLDLCQSSINMPWYRRSVVSHGRNSRRSSGKPFRRPSASP